MLMMKRLPYLLKGLLTVLKESPVQTGTYIKISTKESQEIRKSHMVEGNITAPCTILFKKPLFSSFPPACHF
jgi:hypothetical protein